jgi:hypothetical protein
MRFWPILFDAYRPRSDSGHEAGVYENFPLMDLHGQSGLDPARFREKIPASNPWLSHYRIPSGEDSSKQVSSTAPAEVLSN